MKTLTTIAAATLFAAGAAYAAPTLAELDTDGDGGLNLTELQATYTTMTEDGFVAIDTNADGSVDEAELTAAVDGGILVMVE
jgi:hypothetical protein